MPVKYQLLYDPLSDVKDKNTVKRMVVWRIVNILMTVFFALAAVANVNDSDWYIWVPIYLIPAVLSLMVAVKPAIIETSILSSLTAVVLAVFVGYGVYLIAVLIDTIKQKPSLQNPLIHEEGREFAGMVIIIIWLTISRFTGIGKTGESATSDRRIMTGLLLMTLTLGVLPILAWMMCFIGDNHKHIGHCSGMFKS
ncbi:transmembrane protein 220 [Patella vulgata]|uniref:transmembrane protein 220 n=1 Tax=Patella vulgata TaxID=6465 RepID=UPI00217F5570|nr:transmembrane protein 220 [Patella vulgata]XP_050391982.1 transmembrane protein 220 [Patella vulgata]